MPTRRPHPCLHRAALAAMACTAWLAGACWSSNFQHRHRSQQRYARSLAPAAVASAAPRRHSETRKLRVRAYADAQYRGQVLRWQAKLRRQIARANDVLGPTFGVELELVDARPWDRTTSTTDLDGSLTELQQLDPADDVDWVIGLITQLPEVSASLHQLGAARPLSPYFVMRGMNDVAERKMLDEIFDSLDDSARAKLYEQRREHKELTLFLHEWAHTLGAMHTRRSSSLMSPAYDHEVSTFTPQNIELIEIGLRYRGRGAMTADDYGEMARAMRDHLAAHGQHWVTDERAAMIAHLAAAPEVAATRRRLSARVTPAGREAYARAIAHFDAARSAQAFEVILPLSEQYDDEPQIQRAACLIASRARGAGYPTTELCARTAALAPDDPTPALALAHAHFAANDEASGVAELRRAHAVLDRAGDAARAADWHELAGHYHQRELVSWLEQCLDHLADTARVDELRAWARQTRQRYGLPAHADDLGVPPEREAAYLAAIKEIFTLTYDAQYERAEAAAARAAELYPRAPGVHIARCDLGVRLGRLRAARRACDRALKLDERAMWAHYLRAGIAVRAKHHAVAARHLQRAIELEPSLDAPWKLLARVYGAVGDDDALRALERAYEAQFDRRLTP